MSRVNDRVGFSGPPTMKALGEHRMLYMQMSGHVWQCGGFAVRDSLRRREMNDQRETHR